MGTASWVWVLPSFITSQNSLLFPSMHSYSFVNEGINLFFISRTAAICMAVGKQSLLDWLLLTWSLGWTGFLLPISPPRIWIARFEITSFVFMLDWVPLPVCHTTRGKCSLSFPCYTSSAAWIIELASELSKPYSKFAFAAHFFRIPKARMICSGILSVGWPMSKFWSDL